MTSSFSARESGTFMAELTVVPVDFPYSDQPTSAQAISSMMRAVHQLEPGTIAVDRRFLPGVSDELTHVDVINIPNHGKTRRASKHKVGFRQLLLHSDDEGETSLHVASKTMSVSALAHEYGVTSLVAEGEIPRCDTFTPVGVARSHAGASAMLTQYRHPVRSMDNIFANPALIDEDAVVDTALRRAGSIIATPHASDWVQRDTQVKNVVWDISATDTDRTFLNDLETAEPVSHLSQGKKDGAKLQDIRTFIASAQQLEDVGCEMPENFRERIVEVFGTAYVERLTQLGAVATDIDKSLIAHVFDELPRIRGDKVVSTKFE